MTEFLLVVAIFILATVAVGLARILRGPGDADRMMAAQLLGSGGVAALLLGVVTAKDGVVNVALTIALLAAFASVTFYKGAAGRKAAGDADAARRRP